MSIVADIAETRKLLDELKSYLEEGLQHGHTGSLAKKLGAHTDGRFTRFMIWHPRLLNADECRLELFLPDSDLLYDKPEQHASMRYYSFPMSMQKEFACITLEGVPFGDRNSFGAFYQFRLMFSDATEAVIRDPMAWSLPYGIHAPAEVYHVKQVLDQRRDKAYYQKLESVLAEQPRKRIPAAVNLLEIHLPTATADGSIESLTNRFVQISEALKTGRQLTPADQNLTGFDAIQLMPVDPVAENPEKHRFWRTIGRTSGQGTAVTVTLRKPNIINWGYDTTLFGATALNPALLTTGRPHELLELIETLHNYPGKPIKVVIDLVYGHADNQAAALLPEPFFAGPGEYGLSIRFRHPMVRAMILEMQRRKINWGFDGVRVDASQDFKYYDPKEDQTLYDDDFLKEMSAVKQEVAGVGYRPWMIFEDGRPWPRDDWELAATCQTVIRQQKHAWQWAPMIFAYNTPYVYTYWLSKWWRIREHIRHGDQWITGYANHDTLRRGTQTDPDTLRVNFLLGNSLKTVLDNAYNHPSATLLMSAFLPGTPMDFLQGIGSSPWTFMRNTDTHFAIKVVAEEAQFTRWQISETEYRNSRFFRRLKALGFRTLRELQVFSATLQKFVQITEYQTEQIVELLNIMDRALEEEKWNLDKLTRFADAWMEDMHEYCNVDLHSEYLDPKKTEFNLKARLFRLNNPWLSKAFDDQDFLRYREPVDGAILFYGYRKDPDSGRELILIANMEGQTRQVHPLSLDLPVENPSDWSVALATPSVNTVKIEQPVRLSISQAVLYQK